MFEMWYNIKSGRARPRSCRKNTLWFLHRVYLHHGLGVTNPFSFSKDYPLPYGCRLVPTSDFSFGQVPTRDCFFSPLCERSFFGYPYRHGVLADSRGIESLFVGWQPTVLTFGRTIHLGRTTAHFWRYFVWAISRQLILFPILPNGREKTRHCPSCTRQYSLTDFPI